MAKKKPTTDQPVFLPFDIHEVKMRMENKVHVVVPVENIIQMYNIWYAAATSPVGLDSKYLSTFVTPKDQAIDRFNLMAELGLISMTRQDDLLVICALGKNFTDAFSTEENAPYGGWDVYFRSMYGIFYTPEQAVELRKVWEYIAREGYHTLTDIASVLVPVNGNLTYDVLAKANVYVNRLIDIGLVEPGPMASSGQTFIITKRGATPLKDIELGYQPQPAEDRGWSVYFKEHFGVIVDEVLANDMRTIWTFVREQKSVSYSSILRLLDGKDTRTIETYHADVVKAINNLSHLGLIMLDVSCKQPNCYMITPTGLIDPDNATSDGGGSTPPNDQLSTTSTRKSGVIVLLSKEDLNMLEKAQKVLKVKLGFTPTVEQALRHLIWNTTTGN